MSGAWGSDPAAGQVVRPAVGAELDDARPLTGSTASGIGAVPHMAMRACADGLTLLDSERRQVRRWGWDDVDGWDASGVAPDGEGGFRQVLTIRARPADVVVLADARRVGPFLSGLAAACAKGKRRAASAERRRHWSGRRIAAVAAAVALVGGLAAAVPSFLHHPPAHAGQSEHHSRGALAAFGDEPLHLAKTTAAPAPAPASIAATPLAAHEALGFLPYWSLPDPASIDLSSLTTLAYFSVDVKADGAVDESPSNSGWVGYESQALANVVDEAHHDGQRVVLTATCFDQAALDALTHDPAAQATLASTLVSLVRAKNLDGVNLDFEGTGPTDRTGLDQLVATVSHALDAADPAWQFTVDTYASSAGDPGGFYDVAGMAPFVDAFVVMDYDMGTTFAAGPTAPVTGAGVSDQEVATSYSEAAGASKVILASPLYGEDWPTTGPTAGDPATGPPSPVADDQIAPTDTVYWDPATGGPWAVYRVGRQWHQVWFDDPVSLAAKAQLAQATGLRGVGLWALGMADGTGDQQSAVTGVPAEPQPPDGPVTVWRGPRPGWFVPAATGAPLGAAGGTGAATPSSAGAAGGAATAPPAASGAFGVVEVSLVPWSGAAPTSTTPAGTLSAFTAAGTSVACLSSGGPLPVVQIDGTSAYLVVATTPADCAAGTWAFVLPAGGSGASGSGSGGAGSDGSGTGGSGASAQGTGPSGTGSGGTGGGGGTTPTTGAATDVPRSPTAAG